MPEILSSIDLLVDISLNLGTPEQTLSGLAGRAVIAIDQEIKSFSPNLTFVQGDTTTAFAAALASTYSCVPVGHVEAGLRTWDRRSPFPEEINRQSLARLADLHFAPTENARRNLLLENISDESIFVAGNSIVDATLWAMDKLSKGERTRLKIQAEITNSVFHEFGAFPFAIVTMHRRENAGPIFDVALSSIAKLAKLAPNFHWVFPVHPNPNIKKVAIEKLSAFSNVHLVQPLGYLTFLHLMSQSSFILSDSGGIQEEAVTLGKKTFLLRNNTERPEGLLSGLVTQLTLSEESILSDLSSAIESQTINVLEINVQNNPFGDGKTSQRILERTETFLNKLN
jgi:UDP-N-acetylglucosamine 2-epimerase (non-hydrolysing)